MTERENPERVSGKKEYRSPEFTEYGTLADLTLAKGATKSDGGVKPTTRSTGAPA
jgi:hypothetical protein